MTKIVQPKTIAVRTDSSAGDANNTTSFLENFMTENAKKSVTTEEKEKQDWLKEQIVAALSQIRDPEIPVNIYDLGLIYDIKIDEDSNVAVTMTLTTPNCPVAESMPSEVETRLSCLEGVKSVCVKVVWNPPWDSSKMSDAARLELGFL